MIYFTSDQHYWHARVIEYCNRPFSSIEEMNAGLIALHNRTVSPDDTTYMLGDFCFGNQHKMRTILSQLNGTKILIRGNHDRLKDHKLIELGFSAVSERSNFDDMLLSHYPYRGAEHDERDERFVERQYVDEGSWLLHGHVHQHWKKKARMINVGVDVWNLRPASLAEILTLQREKTDAPLDL